MQKKKEKKGKVRISLKASAVNLATPTLLPGFNAKHDNTVNTYETLTGLRPLSYFNSEETKNLHNSWLQVNPAVSTKEPQ